MPRDRNSLMESLNHLSIVVQDTYCHRSSPNLIAASCQRAIVVNKFYVSFFAITLTEIVYAWKSSYSDLRLFFTTNSKVCSLDYTTD